MYYEEKEGFLTSFKTCPSLKKILHNLLGKKAKISLKKDYLHSSCLKNENKYNTFLLIDLEIIKGVKRKRKFLYAISAQVWRWSLNFLDSIK